MITEEIRNYEVSLWTLLDEFITVLRWPKAEYKGMILDPKLTLADDGTLEFTFTIPMYIYKMGELVENPIWYNTRNGNLMINLRKIKVIFNKFDQDKERIFEFLITKITEEHEEDHLFCNVECEGLAFHELGKIGYAYELSAADFELDDYNWKNNYYWYKHDGTKELVEEPRQNVLYWCDKIGLNKVPINAIEIDPRKWYYEILMDWSSFEGCDLRRSDMIYEEAFVSSWQYKENENKIMPTSVTSMREKWRTVEAKESNIYNITLTIAETFGIYCKYEYGHDTNYHITSRKVIFFNNYINEGLVFSLTYPYSSKKITREVDSKDIVTKLYVKAVENPATLAGEDSICYCEANKTLEEYILNFDYLKETGSITKELITAIDKFETDIGRINRELFPIENLYNIYSNLKVELEAKKTFYINSIALDEETINRNEDFRLSLNKLYPSTQNDGYLSIHTQANPDYGHIVTDDKGVYCIKLQDKEKGILPDSVELYRDRECNNQLGSFYFSYNEYGNPDKIYGVAPTAASTTVYMVYDHRPQLYYDNIIQVLRQKLSQDGGELENINNLLNGYDESNNGNITQHILGVYEILTNLNTEKENLYKEKLKLKDEFAAIMGPALREGNWTPEDYLDFNERHEGTRALATLDERSIEWFATKDTGNDFILGWDIKKFDTEEDIYYLNGINEEQKYYPCVNLAMVYLGLALISTEDKDWMYDFKDNMKDYSFIFNCNYINIPSENNVLDSRYIRSFAIGSEAILGFVKEKDNNNIWPVLILVGAKNMSLAMIEHMLDVNRGHPCIGKIKTELNDNNEFGVTIDGKVDLSWGSLGSAPYFWFGDHKTIEQCEIIYPRIKISSLLLNINNNFYVEFAPRGDERKRLLKNYEEYYITTRNIEAGTYAPECLITIKPEVLLSSGILDNVHARQMQYNGFWNGPIVDLVFENIITVSYTISNASTAIYLDALDIAKENAFPKVSYTVDPFILKYDKDPILDEYANDLSVLDNTRLTEGNPLYTLYDKLNWLVMINDALLKFKNTFGYISKIEMELDFPDKDRVEIKNYKTKFEDLFSSIVATTEEMKTNSKIISSMANGYYTMSQAGLESTLNNNRAILTTYLDNYFDSSAHIKETLSNLFKNVGAILTDVNSSQNYNMTITEDTSEILNQFDSTLSDKMVPTIYRDENPPETFKKGDMWILVDLSNQELARYVSMSDSGTATDNSCWVTTYNGVFSLLKGNALNIDTTNGNVSILTQSSIITNANLDIYGGNTINITDTNISLISKYYNINDDRNTSNSILLIALTYNNEGDYSISSLVNIKPTIIKLLNNTEALATNITTIESSGIVVGQTGIGNNNTILSPIENGSYVSISGAGIIIGNNSTFTLTTNNFKVNPTPTNNGDTYVYIGAAGNNPGFYIKYVKYTTDYLEVKGKIIATDLSLNSGATWNLNDILLNKSRTATSGGSAVNTVEIMTGKGLVLGSTQGIYILKTANSTLNDAYLIMDNSQIKLDYGSSKTTLINNTGIAVNNGNIAVTNGDITVGGSSVWTHSEIIISTTAPTTHPTSNWIWIKPNEEASVPGAPMPCDVYYYP